MRIFAGFLDFLSSGWMDCPGWDLVLITAMDDACCYEVVQVYYSIYLFASEDTPVQYRSSFVFVSPGRGGVLWHADLF